MGSPNGERKETRRDVLRYGTAGAALVLCGGCAALRVKRRPYDLTVGQQGGAFRFPAVSYPQLANPGGSVLADVSGVRDPVLVFRRTDGALAATDVVCTHEGCEVGYRAGPDRLICPCHGSEFAPDGTVLRGPARKPLPSYSVTEVDGVVTVRVAMAAG